MTPENVQDYPRPPTLERTPHRLRVMLGGALVAETARGWRVLETHHPPTYYVPREDVTAALTPARGGSLCEWKGRASYWHVEAGGTRAPRAAWSYEDPTRPFAPIAGHLAFYASRFDAWVGEERAWAQDGDFYGGWMTSNIRGTAKGAPGTLHW